MGRTLVLPPAQGMYLLKKDKHKFSTDFDFAHFFPLHHVATEHAGFDMITMEEFLQTEAMTGNLVDKETGQVSFPPDNRTAWDGVEIKPLKEWLRNVTFIEHWWKPGQCLAAFPASVSPKDVEALEDIPQAAIQEQHAKGWKPRGRHQQLAAEPFIGHPVDVDASALDRFQEAANARTELCIYNDTMQEQLVVHFMCYHKMRVRYLVHFYAFLFFQDWRHDLWMKRFMRDHLHYVEEIQCAAARIVAAVRKHALEKTGSPQFDTMHIRRGDFQFKDTRVECKEIIENSKDVLNVTKTIFIATDERDKKFFDPFRQAGYDILFLDDFKPLLKDVNTNYFGMIDQLIASKGDVFLGCWHSTFTGYIMRLRGYHSTKRHLAGYQDGTLPTSYYYITLQNKLAMHEYVPLMGAFFNREFPTSWRDLDKNVEIINAAALAAE